VYIPQCVTGILGTTLTVFFLAVFIPVIIKKKGGLNDSEPMSRWIILIFFLLGQAGLPTVRFWEKICFFKTNLIVINFLHIYN